MTTSPFKSKVPRKRLRFALRHNSFLLAEVGLILSLSLLNVAMRVDLQFEEEFIVPEFEHAVVEMEEVEQTEQIDRPPPPPRPLPPVSVPNDEILEDEIIDIDAEIDLLADIDLPPPPPPASSAEDAEPEIFVVVEEMPTLVGGFERLHELVEYPELAVKAGLEGQVIVQFVVETDGSISSPAVVRSAGGILDEAALKAVAKMEFTPGRQRGVPVRVKFALPVRFNLTQRAT